MTDSEPVEVTNRFTPHTAFGVATAEPYGATRWRFHRASVQSGGCRGWAVGPVACCVPDGVDRRPGSGDLRGG